MVEKFLISMGFISCLAIIVSVIVMSSNLIAKFICKLHWRHKYKHRFDEKPIAKCYCKDCKYSFYDYNNDLHCLDRRHDSVAVIAENQFCSLAEPKSEEK